MRAQRYATFSDSFLDHWFEWSLVRAINFTENGLVSDSWMDAYVEVFIVFFIMLFPVWDQNWQGPDSDPRMNACAATLMAVWLRF